ncbi:peptidoglycan DD-metalloendopeptidase family protein [Mycolicibacterium wolinskyi]|uniref:peptidoglycan DD-metalloendopeptidase family protein n=1 Tax=Mycolicibacterium wolinskyi TaxID=59750 RepID=UPI003917B532
MAIRCSPMKAGTYTLSSGFGMRWGQMHRGLDFAAKDGTPIYAAQGGTVQYIGPADGFGQWIVIDHPAADGAGTTVYGHMWNAFATGLKRGQRVEAGQLIAYVGANGKSTGPHLHFEVHPTVWRKGSQIDPKPWLVGAREPGAAPPVPSNPPTGGTMILADPITKPLWTRANRYAPRGMPSPMWIACHTSESRSRAVNLRNFCENNSVSYNRIVDDIDIVGMVRDSDAPWAAVGANKYAYHICWSWSFASWSREQWLDPNPSDGFDERNALRLGAKQIAFWIQQSRAAGRAIPVEWIGGRNRPPWGLNGICGHVDFGQWGGGHTDPGVNFPVNTLLSDVREFLTGQPQPPIVSPPPVVKPGTNPDRYADWMLYQGNPSNNIDRVRAVQRRLKYAYDEYAGHLAIDGDFGPLTRMAVEEFQRRSKLIADGIVGPMTAAALKP